MIAPRRDPPSPISTGPLPKTTADAMLAVVPPDTCGPGGDLLAIVHHPGDERPVVLNGSDRCGTNASAATLRGKETLGSR